MSAWECRVQVGIVAETARYITHMDSLERILGADSDAGAARRALLQAGEEISGSGTWAWDLTTGQRLWSENMYRILDSDPQEDPSDADAAMSRVHPADRLRLKEALEQAEAGAGAPTIRYRILTQRGAVRFVQAVMAGSVTSEGHTILVGWLRDLTETDRAEREIAAHIAVTQALSEWDGFDDGAKRLICELARALGFDRALLWVVMDGVLAPKAHWHARDDEEQRQGILSMRLSPGEGLAGIAWEMGTSATLASARNDPEYQFQEVAAREGLQGAVAVPIIAAGQVLGVISLTGPDRLEMTDRLSATLNGIGHEIGGFLERRSGQWSDGLLSPREVQILQLASEGLSGPAIAVRLVISPATVKTHFEHIYAKYGVPDRVAAVAKAIRAGLIH
jgi:DNA-binding CsgD family transcriptional regulator